MPVYLYYIKTLVPSLELRNGLAKQAQDFSIQESKDTLLVTPWLEKSLKCSKLNLCKNATNIATNIFLL
jgi:hypothetical protein